jgi:hypothetical protein
VDSKSALALAKNPIFHERSTHIRVRHHFIRDCLEEGNIKTGYINSKDQLVDLLTKPLDKIMFWSSALRSGWSRFPTRRCTRLRGRMMNKSLYLIFMRVVFLSILDCF